LWVKSGQLSQCPCHNKCVSSMKAQEVFGTESSTEALIGVESAVQHETKSGSKRHPWLFCGAAVFALCALAMTIYSWPSMGMKPATKITGAELAQASTDDGFVNKYSPGRRRRRRSQGLCQDNDVAYMSSRCSHMPSCGGYATPDTCSTGSTGCCSWGGDNPPPR